MGRFDYVVNVDCAVVHDGEYLFVRRSEHEDHAAGERAFPGGKLEADPGTTAAIAATARREVREETGVEIRTPTVVTSSTFLSDDGLRVLNVVTTARYDGGTARVNDPAEVAAVEWLTPTAVREDPDTPGFLLAYLDSVVEVWADETD